MKFLVMYHYQTKNEGFFCRKNNFFVLKKNFFVLITKFFVLIKKAKINRHF